MDWREEAEKDRADPEFVFEMDGSAHFRNETTGCCTTHGKQCRCGGHLHFQPVYGGYYYKCEVCGTEQ